MVAEAPNWRAPGVNEQQADGHLAARRRRSSGELLVAFIEETGTSRR
jgi:hypothetical protein